MKVLIATEGGTGRGLGHLTRCTALAQAFLEAGCQVRLMVDGDVAADPGLPPGVFESVAWLQDPQSVLDQIRDVLVVDSYLAPPDFYRTASRRAAAGWTSDRAAALPGDDERGYLAREGAGRGGAARKGAARKGICVYLDDDRRMTYPPGIVVNGALYAECLSYPSTAGVEYLRGARFFPLRREFWEAGASSPRPKVSEILLTFGFEDEHGLALKLGERIRQVWPGMRQTFVAGRIPPHPGVSPWAHQVAGADAGDMVEIMQHTDLAVAAAGQTLCELARLGVPTVAIACADNQLPHLKAWEKAGFVRLPLRHDDADLLDKVQDEIERLLPLAARRRRSRAGRRHLDGNGCRRLVRRILARAEIFGKPRRMGK